MVHFSHQFNFKYVKHDKIVKLFIFRINKCSKLASDELVDDYTIRSSTNEKTQQTHSTLKSWKGKQVDSINLHNNDTHEHKTYDIPSSGNYFQKGLEAQATMDAYETLQKYELERLNKELEEETEGVNLDRKYVKRAMKPLDSFPKPILGEGNNRQSVGPILLFNEDGMKSHKAYDITTHGTFGV